MNKALVSFLTLLTVLVSFMFFQVLILESRLVLTLFGLFLGLVSLGIFGYSVRSLTMEQLGLTSKGWKKQAICGLLAGSALYAAFALYRLVSSTQVEPIYLSHVLTPFEALSIVVIVVSEEFFFRGYAISSLGRYVSKLFSSVVSSICFVLYHQVSLFQVLVGIAGIGFVLDYERLLILFAGSLLLSFFFVKTRSLVMPVAVHLTWNLLVFSTMSFEVLPVLP